MSKWQNVLAVANEFQGEPIVFIAVNSGNSAKTVAAYMKKHKVNLPTIVDADRSWERATLGGRTISLQLITSYRTIDAKGGFNPSSSDLKRSAKQLLKDAKWNVDPKTMPPSMKDIWKSVEFGNFPAVAKPLTKAQKSKKPEIKSAAQELDQYIRSKLKTSLAKAAEHRSKKEDWQAYKTYSSVQMQFDGFDTPDVDLKKVTQELAASDRVKDELAAGKQLKNAMRTAGKSGMKKAASRLNKLIKQYPNSEAAEMARDMLNKAQSPKKHP